MSSCLVFGFTSRRMYSLSSCQRFSIGFKSGDSAGVLHQLIFFSCRKFCANRDVCLGSLSAMNLWLVGITRAINGSNVRSSMFTYSGAFIIPSKMHIWVGPFLLMPAQTWTFVGCFALREKEIINKSIPLFCVLKLYAQWLWFRGLPLLSAARSSV